MSDSLKDISKLKVADLKRELKMRGLSSVGNKQELQDRLQVALQDGTDSALLLDDTGVVDTEDILNEDDVLADEDDSSTNAQTDVGSASLKRQLDEELDEDVAEKTSVPQTQDNGPPAKKITLNRKALSQSTPVPLETSEPEDKPKEETEDKKVVKLTEVGMKERLALRAAKFGATTSVEAKKLARVARFGDAAPTDAKKSARVARFGEAASTDAKKEARTARFGSSASSVTSAGNVPEVNVDLLKKRAERFGIQPGSKIELAELEERKKKRLERFGGSQAEATNGSSKAAPSKTDSAPVVAKPGRIPITAPSSSSASSKSNLDEKKKLRAERFKSSTVVSAK